MKLTFQSTVLPWKSKNADMAPSDSDLLMLVKYKLFTHWPCRDSSEQAGFYSSFCFNRIIHYEQITYPFVTLLKATEMHRCHGLPHFAKKASVTMIVLEGENATGLLGPDFLICWCKSENSHQVNRFTSV